MSRPLDGMFERIEASVARFAPAAMFALAAGHDSLYERLVGCLLSVRTLDETGFPASVALFERARTPGCGECPARRRCDPGRSESGQGPGRGDRAGPPEVRDRRLH